jgi:hypothetical protein
VDQAEQIIVLQKKTGKSGSFETIRIADVLEIYGDLVDDMD